MGYIQEFFANLPLIGRFAIVFGLIFLLPRMVERLGLPGVLGLILGGILLGPNLLGILNPKSHLLELFSDLGKLFLMFFAGFEINLKLFKQVGKSAAVFGLLTFTVPLTIGIFVGVFMGYGMNTSVLIGSLMASHTLLGLPILKKYDLINANPSIITVGATIFTDIAAMIVLAMCLSIHLSGFSWSQLLISALGLAIYIPFVIFGLSWLAKKIFDRFPREEMQFTILILLITVAAMLAEVIHLEGIVGAFLTGISVNRAVGSEFKIGHTLSIVSESLFIPVFFLATGFLVDFRIFIDTIVNHWNTVLLVVGGLIISKYIAAFIAGKSFSFNKHEILLMWSLSIPQVAATLAATIVAYNTLNDQGQRLLDESMLNAIIVLIIVTAVLGPILTKNYAKELSKKNS